MHGRLNIYINSAMSDAYDQLQVISDINHHKNFSTTLNNAVKAYIMSVNNSDILADKSLWDKKLQGMSKKELLELNTLIGELNKRIIEKL